MIIESFDVLTEWTYFIRNSDILSTTERNVTTDTNSGTFASDSTHIINVGDIKNIRSLVVASVTLNYGEDYLYDVNNGVVGSKNTLITFTSPQTGAFTITFDNGPDKIFPDYPKDNLSIGSFPRVACDIISEASTPQGFGGGKIAVLTNFLLSSTAYADNTRKVRTTNDAIKTAVMNNQNGFFFFRITLPQDATRISVSDNLKEEILQQTRDFISITNLERP